MKTSIQGFPRIGSSRELKFRTEAWFQKKIRDEDLLAAARTLRAAHWKTQSSKKTDFIPSNDFSLYDNLLDTAVLLGAIPGRYTALNLSPLETYFAMARGYQGNAGDVKALAMKKWFNTNYHYLVPELENETEIKLAGSKPFDEYLEARALGIETKPVIIGPFTFLKLAHITGEKTIEAYEESISAAYAEILDQFGILRTTLVEFDEPYLSMDLDSRDLSLFASIYRKILASEQRPKVLLQTCFGDIRDAYCDVIALPFDAIGLDFVEGKHNTRLIRETGFPGDKLLVAGVVNGKNIWRNDYRKTLATIGDLSGHCARIAIGTSCSLLHAPHSLRGEDALPESLIKRLAFAEEKLDELAELAELWELREHSELSGKPTARGCAESLKKNAERFEAEAVLVHPKAKETERKDWTRLPSFSERAEIQKKRFRLPVLPTTTIGSFPQTDEVKHNRSLYKKGEITEGEYVANVKKMIADCIALQEEIGLDVLVHGEYERNDMVEYFGENLEGFVFTARAWVQSYGTRCVKPPIIAGDISRKGPITVGWSAYAQSLTKKPVKGMLTGPVTILNWSFPREDIPLSESAYQIAFAIREEVLDLEKTGISIIQIDEAALKEKLPLRKADWHAGYLDWAIPAFNLVHSGVRSETQIHTHMCYSEFTDIIPDIDAMDADVISFEASRSGLSILDSLAQNRFRTSVGPGLYDIHSPRVPSVDELEGALRAILAKIPACQVWVNPDCGLKTRGTAETNLSLRNLVEAAKRVRDHEKIHCP